MKKIVIITLSIFLFFITFDVQAYHHIDFKDFKNDFINNSQVVKDLACSIDTTSLDNEIFIICGSSKIALIYDNGLINYDSTYSINDDSNTTINVLNDVIRRIGYLYGYDSNEIENYISNINSKSSIDGAYMDYSGNVVNKFEVSLLNGYRGLTYSSNNTKNSKNVTETTILNIENPDTGDLNTAFIMIGFGLFVIMGGTSIYMVAKKSGVYKDIK